MIHHFARRRAFIAVLATASIIGGVSLVAQTAAASPAGTAGPILAASSAPVSNPDPSPSLAPGQTVTDGHYCDDCQPPLKYLGGPVTDTTGDVGLTVTPIYWAPSGSKAIPAHYQSVINTYIADVADDSGTSTNVYSIATEYYAKTGKKKKYLHYQITAGAPIVDTAALPADGCKPAKGYDSCITDDQMRAELTQVIAASGQGTGLGHFYPMFFAPGVETQGFDKQTSADNYCGYHGAFGSGDEEILYGNEPYPAAGMCDTAGQAPNDLSADIAIDTLSHELMETLTDPDDSRAWNDKSGSEIGDICADNFGKSLGSTDDSDADHTRYNQVINGHYYYTQTEFSNKGFGKNGVGNGCLQHSATKSAARTITTNSLDSYATPNNLAADGTSTSDILELIADSAGNVLAGDSVRLSTYAVTGKGACGSLSALSAITDDQGSVKVTYTASTANVVCAIVALEANGGQSSTVRMYQGTYQKAAPEADDSFPSSVKAGEWSPDFTTSFTNNSNKAINAARITFVIFPSGKDSKNVKASQLKLSYSTTRESNLFTFFQSEPTNFTNAHLDGSTGDGGSINASIGKAEGVSIKAHSTYTVTYRIWLANSVPTSSKKALLSFEAYLELVNVASGSTSNIADTLSSDVKVVTP